MSIIVTKYFKNKQIGSLVAYFSISIKKFGNFYINGMKLIRVNGNFYIRFPEQKYKKNEKISYCPYVGFEEKETFESFQKKVLHALDEYAKKNKIDNEENGIDFSKENGEPF